MKLRQELITYKAAFWIFSVLCLLLIAHTGRLQILEQQRIDAEKKIADLAFVLEARWSDTGYAPSFDELQVWLNWIQKHDIKKRGLIFWAGFIDRESEGNPTSRPTCDSGKSRGLGSIQNNAFEDFCYRTGRTRPRRFDVALYNPLLNIEVMMTEFEFYVEQYANTAYNINVYSPVGKRWDFPLAWAGIAYNSGSGVASRLRRRGINPRFTFYGDVMERVKNIKVALNQRRKDGQEDAH